MCTGVEIALIGSAILGTAGTAASSISANKSAKRQAAARNNALSNFLDKNEALSTEARETLQRRLDQENVAPQEAIAPLRAKRQDAASEAIDRASVSAPIPLGGNVPQVVANRAAAAQSSTDIEAKRRAEALAGTRAFGDLLFEKGLATQGAGRDIGMINTFAQANARLLPIQQDLAQTSAASRGGLLGKVGGIASALGQLGMTAAGAGVFGGSAAPQFSPVPKPKPINLGFG